MSTILNQTIELTWISQKSKSTLNTLLFRGGPGGSGTANGTNANRVPGQPLFLKDLNCHCYDPNKEFVLNPAAWADPLPGQFGVSAPYYDDYRQQRRPQESLSVGRVFRLGEGKANLNVRVEFSNIFNRAYSNNPDSTNARATRTGTDAAGRTVTLAPDAAGHVDGQVASGFGRINAATTFSNFLPRQGTIVARLTF